MAWSTDKSYMTPKQLYSLWRNRFALSLRAHDKLQLICESKNQYDQELWEVILEGAKSLNTSHLKTTVNAIETATIATRTALNLISATYDTVDKENIPPQPLTIPIENTAASVESYNDDEVTIHSIAHKKLSEKLSNDDLNYLKNFQSDGSPKSDLLLLSSKLLQKEKITVLEESVLELSLSGIYNYIHPAFVEIYEKELNRPLPPQTNDDVNDQVPKDIIAEVFKQISESNMDEALYYIQIEKSKLCKSNERKGDRYVILSIVEKVIEDTELWSKCGDEQELTFYRRFASILDVMFKGSEVILSDGETGCQSSRIAIEANKCVFAGEDISPTYSRKIDLLLKYDEKKAIDLCSNEWKKCKVTNDIKLKQQSKNMRVNACIINNLRATYGEFHSVLALDVIGLNGYMYKLTNVDNYFIATSCSIIIYT
ncbi:unnamed protein product [Mucor hiemalis]